MEDQVERCDSCHRAARVKSYRVAAAPREPGLFQSPARLRATAVATVESQLCLGCRWEALRSDYFWMGSGMLSLVLLAPWLDADLTALASTALVVAFVLFPVYWFSPSARKSLQRYVFELNRQRIAQQAGLVVENLIPIFDPKPPSSAPGNSQVGRARGKPSSAQEADEPDAP